MMWLTEDVECVGDCGVRTFVADVISKYGGQKGCSCLHACSFFFVCLSLCAQSLFTLQLSSGATLVRRKFFGVSYARGMRETAARVRVA